MPCQPAPVFSDAFRFFAPDFSLFSLLFRHDAMLRYADFERRYAAPLFRRHMPCCQRLSPARFAAFTLIFCRLHATVARLPPLLSNSIRRTQPVRERY